MTSDVFWGIFDYYLPTSTTTYLVPTNTARCDTSFVQTRAPRGVKKLQFLFLQLKLLCFSASIEAKIEETLKNCQN